MILSNEEKLIVRCTKGHYKKYHEPIKFLVGEIYALEPKHLGESTIMHCLIQIYSKLVESGHIKLGSNPVKELLYKFNEFGTRPFAPKDLYTMIIWDISGVAVEGLDIDEVDVSVLESCDLSNDIHV